MDHVVVWFKRDLRTQDHRPLVTAVKRGSVSCVYFIEPELWRAPDAATQHYQFILESLSDLRQALTKLGLDLTIMVGSASECLSRIWQVKPFAELYSHEETGNALTYERDKSVTRWCRAQGVRWQQFAQFGVRRGPHNRDNWARAWQAHCNSEVLAAPSVNQAVSAHLAIDDGIPAALALGLTDPDPPRRQRGGQTQATRTLNAFLQSRSQQYRGGISSPLSAPTACSRLSPYLSYGCISIREVFQATQTYTAALPEAAKRHRLGLQSFTSRLYWHCHFIQKLEDQPCLEYRNLHRGYDGLRDQDWSEDRFLALVDGKTGWPLVDACVAMLKATGWLNFRMRAMLVSVAAYPLWLHWPRVGHWLARQFLDYEPGIHWSQIQMQSGTTGINVPRIYNPIKQAQDHDPQGRFVRQWIPAMRRVPDMWLFEPWRMPPNLQQTHGVLVGQDIAKPIVELESATRSAKAKVFARRADPEVKAAKAAIIKKHGSRQRPTTKAPTRKVKQSSQSAQLSLDL